MNIVKQFYDQFRTIQNYWIDPNWLSGRMLFVSGPRQVGKTTLISRSICKNPNSYFNWDNKKVRLAYMKDPDFFVGTEAKWIFFDEIHKRPKWKDILKGIYDTHKGRYQFVISGSARLETFKKSGDSLVGRYFHTKLFPINLPDLYKNDFFLPKNSEELIIKASNLKDADEMDSLLATGGFPEPFFNGAEDFWKRWSNNHSDLIIREDLKDLSKIIELDKIEMLLEMLGPAIGNPVSNSNLAMDLETNHISVKRWLENLNRMHLVFSVLPFSRNIRRAYRQEKKWYYTDWRHAEINRFENYVACSLYRACELYGDRFGDKMSLYFVRTHDGAEIDFLICKNKEPWLLIESKEGSPETSKSVYRFTKELNVPCCAVTKRKNFFKKITVSNAPSIYCISWAKLGQVLP